MPATWTRSPATTAREKPATASYGRVPGDQPAFHERAPSIAPVDALHQVDAWDVPFVAVGVTTADAVARDARRRGHAVCRSRPSPSRSRRSRHARRRRGGRRRPRRARWAAGRDRPAPPRPRVGAAVRGRPAHRAAGQAPDLLERGLPRRWATTSPRPPRCRSPEYVTEAAVADAARPRARRERASRARAWRLARRRARASRASSSHRGSSRPRRTRDGRRPVPRARRRAPRVRPLQPARLGARRRAEGGRRRATGRARAPRRATFGHFGGAGTFLWVDPERGVACAGLTTRRFGDWAKEAWPRLSDAVLAELG